MADDSVETLLWGGRQRPARGRKPGLSLDLIATEAIAIADSEGLAALSMKRLAERLHSGVMSLYRYIPGKDELVALMLDTALGRPPAVADPTDWRRTSRDWAMALREIYHEHPWWITVSTVNRVVGPNETAWFEAELRALEALNLTPARRVNVALAISSYVRGAVQPELNGANAPRFGHLAYPETHHRFPLTTAAFQSVDADTAAELGRFFEFGLERLLDGIQAGGPQPSESS